MIEYTKIIKRHIFVQRHSMAVTDRKRKKGAFVKRKRKVIKEWRTVYINKKKSCFDQSELSLAKGIPFLV